MSPQLFVFLGLLAALLVLLWRRRKTQLPGPRPAPPPADAPPGANHHAAESRLHAEELPPGKAFDAATWRQAVAHFSRRGDAWKALQISQAFEQQRPTDFGDRDRFSQAILHSRLHQLPQAVAVYTILIEQPAPYPLAYNNRGYLYNLLGNYELALPDFDQAIALDVSTAFAYNNRGLACLRLGRPAEARADVEHSLLLDPANAYAHRNLGIWHFEHRQFTEALPCFREAARLQWNTPDLEDYLWQTCEQLGVDIPTLPFSDN